MPQLARRSQNNCGKSDVLAILGPANSASCAAVIGEFQEQRIRLPVVSALCSATNLTANLQTQFFFRANISDRKRLSTLLNLAFNDDNLKPRRTIAFYEKADAYGEGMLQDAKAWLAANNNNYLRNDFLELGYPRDISAVEAEDLISGATANGFGTENDAVLLLGLGPDAITFIKALRDKNVKSTIYFNEPDQVVFRSAAERGIPVNGVHILSVYWPDTPMVNSFRSSFQKRFNEEPSCQQHWLTTQLV